MLKVEPRKDEPRIEYLARVLYLLMHQTYAGEETIFYDDVECDGCCLATDILNELGLSESDV